MIEVKSYCMRVENIYPVYKSNHEREEAVQKVYNELQLILFHKSQSEKNCSSDAKKGN